MQKDYQKNHLKRILIIKQKKQLDGAATATSVAGSGGAGLNKEQIVLNIKTFKIQKGKYDLKIIKYNY